MSTVANSQPPPTPPTIAPEPVTSIRPYVTTPDHHYKQILVYALFAAAYVIASDLLLEWILSSDTIARLTHLQMLKGVAFVLVSAAFFGYVTHVATSKIERYRLAVTATRDLYRRLVDWTPNAVFLHVNGIFTFANPAMLKLVGASSMSDLLGKRVLDFVPPGDRPITFRKMQTVADRKQAQPIRVQRLRKIQGDDIWAEIAEAPVDLDGQQAIVCIMRDITDQRSAEEDLLELNQNLEARVDERTLELQQANNDLQTFTYMVSHDLRGPLRDISTSATDLLRSQSAGADPQTQSYMRKVLAAAARLDRLIQDLYEYHKLSREDAHGVRTSLVLVVNEVVGLLQRQPEFAAAEIHVREPMPWVLVHRPTLTLVIQNLLTNAIKFVADGVKPQITISCDRRENGFARLFVEDNGIGVEIAEREKIFHRFEQPNGHRETGSGIGLAIVRRGVERMGGRVGVESASSGGSRFWIDLPIDPESP